MKRLKIVLVSAVALLLLAGCTPSSSSPRPSPTVPATFKTVTALRDAFVAAGGDCPDWVVSNRVKLAAQSGECSGSTVLSIYLDSASRDQAVANLKGFADSIPIHMLVGGNWIINVDSPEDFAEKLNGTAVTAG